MFIYDIETAPLSDEQLALVEPEFSAPANYKDPEKIAEAIAAKRSEWKGRAALSPVTGRVIMIGIRAPETEILAVNLVAWDNYSELDALESQIITEFWKKLESAKHDGKLIVGFNSHRFDLPFLIRRSWCLHVPIPQTIGNFSRGFHPPFIDLMQQWQAGNREDTISLDRLARFLGVGQKNGEGKEVAQLLQKEPGKAREYLENDLILTERCAKRMLTLP